MARQRTNIELEMDHVERLMKKYNFRTKTEAVNFALEYVDPLPMTRKEIEAMRGANLIDHVPPDSGPY